MLARREWMLLGLLLTAPMTAVAGNVITDWDEKAVGIVQPGMTFPPPTVSRTMAILHVAMFDSVNSIERRYKPYLVQLPSSPDTSKEAAAAAAAAAVLVKLTPDAAADVQSTLTSYLATLPDGAAKSNGVKLGQEVVAKILEAREKDGALVADAYRPRTRPGVYIPTPITVGSQFPNVTPFALASPSQFRPKPPPSLKSTEWAGDYNEIKDLGAKNSTKRSARQTEDARFWLITGPQSADPIVRQLATAQKMSVIDCARFMALVAVAATDAGIAVFDAKYHYDFWRPLTAIRNGDIDDNPATERDATWQPIDSTPMHPEYPCAHCTISGAVAGVVKTVLGTAEIPEIAVTSATAPGVTHRWTNMTAFTDEVANARIWAGFHYRFSTRVGTEMGLQIGEYVVKNVMQPAVTSSR